MFAVSRTDLLASPPGTATAVPEDVHCAEPKAREFENHSVPRGETLFRAGETRTHVYQVVRGALCHYMHWDDGRHEIIEFAFPGDIIGFGHLEKYVSTAQAMVDTDLREVSEHELEQACDVDAALAARVSAATDREFDVLRERTIGARTRSQSDKTASLLVALSHINSVEGRDPTLIGDELTSGTVADQLDTTIDGLVRALRDLEQRGLVRATDEGLRITDLDGLEAVVRAA